MSTSLPLSSSRGLSRGEVRTLALASLGGALEFYDFVIFAFFAKLIGQHFFAAQQPDWLRQTETFGLFGAGYLIRPLGGLVMAHFGDKTGRKRMFTLSVLLMALPTLAMGFLPGFETLGIAAPLILLLLRMMQGAAIGGEAPGGWVFVAEHAGRAREGLACGLLTGGLQMGILLGSLVALAINGFLSPAQVSSWGWRAAFVIGGIFGLLAMVLRRWLKETPVFAALEARAEVEKQMPLVTVLNAHRREVILSVIATWALTVAIVVLNLMMPSLMQTLYRMSASATLQASLVETTAGAVSVVLFGIGVDRWGMRAMAPLATILLMAAAVGLYGLAPVHPEWLLPMAALAGIGCGFTGLVPIAMVRAFPAPVRFSGLSFSYNVAYAVFGGMTPMAVSALMAHTALAPVVYILVATLCGGIALWRMPDCAAPAPRFADAAPVEGAMPRRGPSLDGVA